MLSDKEIIEKAQAGDETAFEELYRRFHKIAYYYALKICQHHSDAQDVAQNAFMNVKKSLPDLRSVDYFRPWLYTIVSHQCSKTFRKAKDVLLDNFDDMYDLLGNDDHREYSPQAHINFQSDREVLLHSLNELSAAQRMCIVLFYLEQFSLEEIAKITNTPLGTVKSRLSVARKKLQTDLTAYEQNEGTRITFKSLDALMVVVLKEGFEAMSAPVFSLSPRPKVKELKWLKNLAQVGLAGKVAVLGCIGIVAVGSTIMMNQAEKDSGVEQPVAIVQKEDIYNFVPVTYQGKAIQTERDAYFTLRFFACCEEELMRKSSQQIEEIAPVYKSLQAARNEQSDKELKISWSSEFEKLIK